MQHVSRAAIATALVVLVSLGVAVDPGVKQTEFTVMVPMRDGVHLSTSVYRSSVSKPLPVLLLRTPYGKGTALPPGYRHFLRQGFAVVTQDVRGRYDSEGPFHPLTQEENDGSDTLKWIASQPWCDGNIGMVGGSYRGIVQWKAALSRNPNLKAIFPVVAGYDDYLDRFYSRGGALKLGHRILWIAQNLGLPLHPQPEFLQLVRHLPLRSMDWKATGRRIDLFQQALDHPQYDSFWRTRSTRERLSRIGVPVFFVSGWYDNFAQSDLEAFSALSARSTFHRIVVGPWGHDMSVPPDGMNYGPHSGAPIRGYQLAWFDRWLRNGPPSSLFPAAPVRIFVMGGNRWRDEAEWPLRRARYTPLYLNSIRGANSLRGDGVLANEPRKEHRDQFTYDPRAPVPTTGGAVCCNPTIFPWGPLDQRKIEERKDVLVYSTPPLEKDLEVTGVVRAFLYVSTSALDTDFTAKLVDVYPDGRARLITDGLLRLRYRNSLARSVPAQAGKVYRITIDAGVTSNVFLAGHRIRLEVSSSNFPRFDRNPNTGRLIADEMQLKTARQTVYHGGKRASHLLLPVIP
jgi:putative CocE/NonD family hydrolase